MKNVGELLTITSAEKEPYLNDDLLRKIHECATYRAINKKLTEEYSELSVKFESLIKYASEEYPEDEIFKKMKGAELNGNIQSDPKQEFND